MAGNNDKNLARLETLRKLRHFIDTEYADGGWLPPNRDMNARFGVSYVTYYKALQCLVTEGAVESHPRKGYQVLPKSRRPRKIGLIIGDGGDSPFIDLPQEIGELLIKLSGHGLSVHQIQARTPEKLLSKALTHNVEGIIWFAPPFFVRPTLKAISEFNDLPLVATGFYDPRDSEEAADPPCHYVDIDFQHKGKTRAEFFISRGHRHVAYVGNGYWFAEHIGFSETARQAGIPFGPEDCVEIGSNFMSQLDASLARGIYTALFIDGGPKIVEPVFARIAALPKSKRPITLVRVGGDIRDICRKYPDILPSGLEREDRLAMSVTAVEILAKRVKEGVELTSKRLPITKVTTDIAAYIANRIPWRHE